MDGALVELLPAEAPVDLAELVAQLQREIALLRCAVADLGRETFEHRKQVGYWKAMHARAVQRAEKLAAEVETLRGEKIGVSFSFHYNATHPERQNRDRWRRSFGENGADPPGTGLSAIRVRRPPDREPELAPTSENTERHM